MADNTTLNAVSGTPGDTMRDVQKGGGTGPKTPVAIIDVGGAGAENLLTAGQQTMANSVPVAIASNQSGVPVTGTFWQATQPVSLASLPALAAGTNAIGSVTVARATTGGATPYHYVAAAGANQDSQSVKGSAGTLYGVQLGNVAAAARFVKLYDKATAPTSADTPVKTLIAPASGGSNVPIPAQGIAFAAGIAFRVTTGMADNDTGAATAGDVVVDLDYA